MTRRHPLYLLAFLVLLVLGACGSPEPVQGPAPASDAARDAPDAPAPCGGACGPGTVCSAGVCVAVMVDAGTMDAPGEASAEVGVDAVNELAVDQVQVVDAPGDVVRDAGHELAEVDVAPDANPLDERVDALTIAVTSAGVPWTRPASPRCEVDSFGVMTMTASFAEGGIFATGNVPSMVGVGATAVLRVIVTPERQDPRAALTRGRSYGGAVRMVNVMLRGRIDGATFDVIAQGCTLR